MTDHVSDWHAQFAPAPLNDCGTPVVEVERLGTVEHFAGDDGVFAAPVPVEAEPAAVDAPAEDAAKAKAEKDAESAA